MGWPDNQRIASKLSFIFLLLGRAILKEIVQIVSQVPRVIGLAKSPRDRQRRISGYRSVGQMFNNQALCCICPFKAAQLIRCDDDIFKGIEETCLSEGG